MGTMRGRCLGLEVSRVKVLKGKLKVIWENYTPVRNPHFLNYLIILDFNEILSFKYKDKNNIVDYNQVYTLYSN